METVVILLIGFILFILYKVGLKMQKKKQLIEYDIEREEQRLIDDNYVTTLHILMCKIKDLSKSNYLPEIENKAKEIKEQQKGIAQTFNEKQHPIFVKKALKEYRFTHGPEDVTGLQKSIIEHPLKFDILAFKKQKYAETVNNYAPYWNAVLNGLSRKHAIINRRKYLIENIDMMIELCRKNRYYELINILKNYQTEQITKIKQS